MPYIDAKGRPELIVNPAIKLGMAFFTPVEPAGEAAPSAPPRRAARPTPQRPVRRRRPATETVSAGNASPESRAAAKTVSAGNASPASRRADRVRSPRAAAAPLAGRQTEPPSVTKQSTRGKDEGPAPVRRPGKRKAGDTPTG